MWGGPGSGRTYGRIEYSARKLGGSSGGMEGVEQEVRRR